MSPLGKITCCQICGSKKLKDVINLGHQPPCDLLPDKDGIQDQQIIYPLNIVRCLVCGLVQLDFVPPPSIVFHRKYPYRTGITKMLVDNFEKLAEETITKLALKPNSLVIDIGSNDGTALLSFKKRGMRVVGIEPTDVYKFAIQAGIPTLNEFFSEKIAKRILKKNGHASIVIATNVFAHINNLFSFMNGVSTLLVRGGYFISESQYLLDTIEKVQYDTMYHEHLRFYSLSPLMKLFKKTRFTLTNAQRIASSGGSIQVMARKGMGHKVSSDVTKLLKNEKRSGLYKNETYELFKERVLHARFNLVKLLSDLRLEGKSIAGVGSPGRSSPILNFCHIDTSLVSYLAEQSTSLKLGLFSPGTHIPIVDEDILFKEQPDYALLLSWHIADTLIPKLRDRGLTSKFIIPLPEVKIVS